MPLNDPTYRSWRAMKNRCLNPKCNGFENYGARGITICKDWIESFQRFKSDMGERPEGTQLDRRDVNGPYCKSNCKWSTRLENSNNKRNTVWVTCFGKRMSLGDAIRATGLNKSSLEAFLRRNKSFSGDVSEIKFTPQKKLNESQVLEIRASEEADRPLAKRFNVSRALIRSVRGGLSWRKLL